MWTLKYLRLSIYNDSRCSECAYTCRYDTMIINNNNNICLLLSNNSTRRYHTQWYNKQLAYKLWRQLRKWPSPGTTIICIYMRRIISFFRKNPSSTSSSQIKLPKHRIIIAIIITLILIQYYVTIIESDFVL